MLFESRLSKPLPAENVTRLHLNHVIELPHYRGLEFPVQAGNLEYQDPENSKDQAPKPQASIVVSCSVLSI